MPDTYSQPLWCVQQGKDEATTYFNILARRQGEAVVNEVRAFDFGHLQKP